MVLLDFGGKKAAGVLMSFLLVVLVVDNFRLRRKLSSLTQEKKDL
jgi:hypothetical protein